jgi:hypothetical protein
MFEANRVCPQALCGTGLVLWPDAYCRGVPSRADARRICLGGGLEPRLEDRGRWIN